MRQELVCANCGITFYWVPTVVGGKNHCCLGCAQGGPCCCDYDNLPAPDVTNPLDLLAPEDQPRCQNA